MEKVAQGFINFCFEHGGFIRNNPEFYDKGNELIRDAIKCDTWVKREEIISEKIILSTFAPEIVIPVRPVMDYRMIEEFSPEDISPRVVLVYRYYAQISKDEHSYIFMGYRIQ